MSSNTSSQSKPTVVFIPGAFHTPAHFQPMSTLLQESSFPTITFPRQSVGVQAATSSYRDDIRLIRILLENLIEEEGRDVILAPHSARGVVGCQIVSGFEKNERAKKGQNGGIVHVLFIAALLLAQGQTLVDALGGAMPSWASFDGTVLRPVNVAPVFYGDLSSEEAEHWASLLLPHSAAPAAADVGDVCYDLDVPITYLLCAEDPGVQTQERMVERFKGNNWRVVSIAGGHSPFLSRKEELLEVIQGCCSISTGQRINEAKCSPK